MRITDLLDVRSISLDAAPADKSQTLDAAVALMTRSGKINDEAAYRKRIFFPKGRIFRGNYQVAGDQKPGDRADQRVYRV